MLYHAILQLNQKAKQTAKQSQNITGQKRHVRTKLSNKNKFLNKNLKQLKKFYKLRHKFLDIIIKIFNNKMII